MLISKKKARRMTEEAIKAVSARHAETIGNLNQSIIDLRKERDDLILANDDLKGQLDAASIVFEGLRKSNDDLKRELDSAHKSLDSLMVGIKEEPTCDGCVRAGKYHSKCASCLRNPHAVDKWEEETE